MEIYMSLNLEIYITFNLEIYIPFNLEINISLNLVIYISLKLSLLWNRPAQVVVSWLAANEDFFDFGGFLRILLVSKAIKTED